MLSAILSFLLVIVFSNDRHTQRQCKRAHGDIMAQNILNCGPARSTWIERGKNKKNATLARRMQSQSQSACEESRAQCESINSGQKLRIVRAGKMPNCPVAAPKARRGRAPPRRRRDWRPSCRHRYRSWNVWNLRVGREINTQMKNDKNDVCRKNREDVLRM